MARRLWSVTIVPRSVIPRAARQREVGELFVLDQHIETVPHQHRGDSLRTGRSRRAHVQAGIR
ncbi:hypothetical protein [Streptomyces regalis]|uniref:hypothetical protein n=1 Tax=Streptomyces regalis TaxID=68262 RepID=UPI000A5A2497|nr:hypothetical protein [Streptomyces regalis]